MYGKCIKDETRSIIVVDSPGCSWGKCKFCAVHNQTANDNAAMTQVIEGFSFLPKYETKLQIVSSASFSDYPTAVTDEIFRQVKRSNVKTLILEQRWGLRHHILDLDILYAGLGVKLEWILGLEAVSAIDREFLGKESYEASLLHISKYFQRVNLLYGYREKSFQTLKDEIDSLYDYFNVISINIYENAAGSDIVRDYDRVEEFYNSEEFAIWLADPKIHILDIDPRAESDFGGIDTFERK